MLENDAQMILTYLEANGGFMTLNDKSSPDDDQGNLWDFKRAVQKGFRGADEGQKNQARPIWNRIDLRGGLCENRFILGS